MAFDRVPELLSAISLGRKRISNQHSSTHQLPLQGILGACDVAQRGPKKNSNHPTISARSCQQIRGTVYTTLLSFVFPLSISSTIDNNLKPSVVA